MDDFLLVLLIIGGSVCAIILVAAILTAATQAKKAKIKAQEEKEYKELEFEVLKKLNFKNWNVISGIDEKVIVKSRQTFEKYDEIRFFKENKDKLAYAKKVLDKKDRAVTILQNFLKENEFKEHPQYNRLVRYINSIIFTGIGFRIRVAYISSAGNNLANKDIVLFENDLERFEKDPSLLMGKGEYTKFLKEQEKEALNKKQHKYYERVNKIIDYANKSRDLLFIKGSVEKLDNLVTQLFDRTVNSIKRIKDINSEEWIIIKNFIDQIVKEIKEVVNKNINVLKYYTSAEFLKIKETCEVLMSSQREFNQYIQEKVESISQLFGTRVVRNETLIEDEYNYIRPYKKTITPFTAEVSAAVFASAENNPLEYVIKNFYSNKSLYPEQIQKLHLLIGELATLKEAKQIIDNYKKEYQQYIKNVPNYVMADDEAGFYSRLGFANIDESALTVEYEFSYTSGGGMAKRTFKVPMTEETIVELIKALEDKLTLTAFTKEQRMLMTNKLREYIKKRDNYTCCNCGNSVHAEPNLLLEIDHIIPVSKGGCTVENNLQTLCWKCNRTKSNKMLME